MSRWLDAHEALQGAGAAPKRSPCLGTTCCATTKPTLRHPNEAEGTLPGEEGQRREWWCLGCEFLWNWRLAPLSPVALGLPSPRERRRSMGRSCFFFACCETCGDVRFSTRAHVEWLSRFRPASDFPVLARMWHRSGWRETSPARAGPPDPMTIRATSTRSAPVRETFMAASEE